MACPRLRNGKVTEIHEGDLISIDGTSGAVYLGEVPVADSPAVRYFEEVVQPFVVTRLLRQQAVQMSTSRRSQ